VKEVDDRPPYPVVPRIMLLFLLIPLALLAIAVAIVPLVVAMRMADTEPTPAPAHLPRQFAGTTRARDVVPVPAARRPGGGSAVDGLARAA